MRSMQPAPAQIEPKHGACVTRICDAENHPYRRAIAALDRSLAYLALQRQLGILPGRRIGFRADHRHPRDGHRQIMSRQQGSTLWLGMNVRPASLLQKNNRGNVHMITVRNRLYALALVAALFTCGISATAQAATAEDLNR